MVSPVLVTSRTTTGSPSTHGYGIVISRDSSRSIVLGPSTLCTHDASSTCTCATVTGAGPPFTMCTRSTPRSGSVTRVIVSASTGGNAPRKTPAGPKRKNRRSSASSSTTGPSALSHVSPAPVSGRFEESATLPTPHVEHSRPSELGEFALMRVKEEQPLVLVSELEYRPLTLTQHHVVGELVVGEARARPVQPVEVGVQVKGLDRI